MKKNIAYIFTKAPYSSFAAREAIEEALAFATFEQNVSIFYMGPGTSQLISNQKPPKGVKNINALSAAFPLYDIEKQYLVSESNPSSQSNNITWISPQECANELAKQDIILSF